MIFEYFFQIASRKLNSHYNHRHRNGGVCDGVKELKECRRHLKASNQYGKTDEQGISIVVEQRADDIHQSGLFSVTVVHLKNCTEIQVDIQDNILNHHKKEEMVSENCFRDGKTHESRIDRSHYYHHYTPIFERLIAQCFDNQKRNTGGGEKKYRGTDENFGGLSDRILRQGLRRHRGYDQTGIGNSQNQIDQILIGLCGKDIFFTCEIADSDHTEDGRCL